MDTIKKVKSISVWIFVIPFIAVNTCLILITTFHDLFPNKENVLVGFIFPYFDGGASISRTARVFPTYLIFKPAMFFTSYLLIVYWLNNRRIINSFESDNKYKDKIVYFGIASAIALILHSIFLGIKFDNDLYKLFRRIIMFVFIIFEIVAQTYLVLALYSIKKKIIKHINEIALKIKLILVSLLIFVAVVSIPIISLPGDDFFGINLKFLKHALEWDYFLGVISFYFLTFLMWKKN